MNRHTLKITLLMVTVAVASAGGGYWVAQHYARQATVMAPESNKNATERKALYWYDPMVPQQHFDKPGKSPFMDMELVPQYADDSGDEGGIKISAALTQSLGVRYATVERGRLAAPLTAPASVAFNERDLAIVQTRASGFVERVYARAPGDVIAAGAPLGDVLVPEWAGAQAEYLLLRQAGDAELARAARDRLHLLGMPEAAIHRLETSGQAQSRFTITSPIAGVIQSLDLRQGMSVGSGQTVARINGLATVWLEAALPEAQAGRVQAGTAVEARLAAYPEQRFQGRVSAVLPEANAQTRTLRIRMEFANPQGFLRPGMFAQLQLEAEDAPDTLLLPTEAVIRTGQRNLVIVAEEGGRFRPLAVVLGPETAGQTVILSGLTEGQKVVTSGQFLIDSEASLKGVLARMEAPPATTMTTAASQGIAARGVIEALGQTEITLSHEPIAALDWPAMTMPFALNQGVSPQGLKKGQRIQFTLEKRGDDWVITRIEPLPGMEAKP